MSQVNFLVQPNEAAPVSVAPVLLTDPDVSQCPAAAGRLPVPVAAETDSWSPWERLICLRWGLHRWRPRAGGEAELRSRAVGARRSRSALCRRHLPLVAILTPRRLTAAEGVKPSRLRVLLSGGNSWSSGCGGTSGGSRSQLANEYPVNHTN